MRVRATDVARTRRIAALNLSATSRARAPTRARMGAHASSASASASSALVSADWLDAHRDDVQIVDASWHMPDLKRNGAREHARTRLTPQTVFFDVDKVSDGRNPAPHMLPSAKAFEAACETLKLTKTKPIVVYDTNGMFSAARAWWMFRAHGWENVKVLDGGKPAWDARGYASDDAERAEEDIAAHVDACARAMRALGDDVPGDFKGTRAELVKTKREVVENIQTKSFQVVDARGAARFRGETKEPREGVRSGHIPGSKNVFFGELLNEDKTFKPVEALRQVFETSGLDLSASAKPIVASCGTGVTAAIVALGLHECGVEAAVYDGSWTEYGADAQCPLATGPAA